MRTRISLPIPIAFGIVAFLGSLLLPMASARAENGCPAGYWPWKIPPQGMNDCVAIPDYGEPPEDSLPPPPVWESRWGAIAVGDTSNGGGFGVSSDMKSRRSAEKAAVKECVDTGGGDLCKAEPFAYHDQCAVIAWGDRGYVIRSVETLDRASEVAMQQCNERTLNCIIFYSNCSLPVRVQ